MKFQCVDSITLPGNSTKPNEDRFGQAGSVAWIIDGATGLGDGNCVARAGDSDASWLAQRMQDTYTDLAVSFTNPADFFYETRRRILEVFRQQVQSAPVEDYAWPSAATSIVAIRDDFIECASLGDCTVLFIRKDGGVQVHGGDPAHIKCDTELAQEMVRMRQGAPEQDIQEIRANVLLPHIRRNRSLANRDEGYGSFTLAVPVRDDFIRTSHAKLSDVSHVLMMTDGFYDLVAEYKAYDAITLAQAVFSPGLGALALQTRSIEDMDFKGIRYPRFKKSDDLTAALYTFS